MGMNRLQKQAVVSYVPAVPAVPGRAAFCQEEQVLTGYSSRVVPFGSQVIAVYGPYGEFVRYDTAPLGYRNENVPVYRTEIRCYEEVIGSPAVPSAVNYFANNGWNGGAHSISPVPVNSYFDIRLPDNPVGVMVGFSDGGLSYAYSKASHALVARPGGITPVERGEPQSAPVAGGDIIRMVRTDTGVKAFVDGVLVYESAVPITGTAFVDAALYALSDYVESPVIGAFHQASGVCDVGVTATMDERARGSAVVGAELYGVASIDGVYLTRGTARVGVDLAASASTLYASLGIATVGAAGVGERVGMFAPGHAAGNASGAHGLLGVQGFASQSSTARAVGRLGGWTLEARGGAAEATAAQAAGVLPLPIGSARGLVGVLGQASGVLGIDGKASEGEFAGASGVAGIRYQITSWEAYLPADVADGPDLAYAFDFARMDNAVLFVSMESIELEEVADIYLLISLETLESLRIDEGLSLASVVELMTSERIAASDQGISARREAIQYAVNAITGALSTYQNFGFKQYARAGGDTYAINDGALYRLCGQDDDGAALNAVIDFGASDYGTAQAKRMSSVYAGIATDGEVYLRVTGDDGEEQVYRATGGAMEQRVRTAKGIAARHWRVRLELVDASYADLDNIEIEIGVSQRRIRR